MLLVSSSIVSTFENIFSYPHALMTFFLNFRLIMWKVQIRSGQVRNIRLTY
jgi:hypothetical protein